MRCLVSRYLAAILAAAAIASGRRALSIPADEDHESSTRNITRRGPRLSPVSIELAGAYIHGANFPGRAARVNDDKELAFIGDVVFGTSVKSMQFSLYSAAFWIRLPPGQVPKNGYIYGLRDEDRHESAVYEGITVNYTYFRENVTIGGVKLRPMYVGVTHAEVPELEGSDGVIGIGTPNTRMPAFSLLGRLRALHIISNANVGVAVNLREGDPNHVTLEVTLGANPSGPQIFPPGLQHFPPGRYAAWIARMYRFTWSERCITCGVENYEDLAIYLRPGVKYVYLPGPIYVRFMALTGAKYDPRTSFLYWLTPPTETIYLVVNGQELSITPSQYTIASWQYPDYRKLLKHRYYSFFRICHGCPGVAVFGRMFMQYFYITWNVNLAIITFEKIRDQIDE